MARWSFRNRANSAQAVDQGYAHNTPNIDPADRLWNAYLVNQEGDRLYLWIENVTQGFEMGGTTAQSVDRRTFFPHNFVQPRITVEGIVANQHQYARLGEFVRETQLMAVGSPGWAQAAGSHRTIDLWIIGGGMNVRNTKGVHKPMHAEGYIQTIKRGATRFEFAKQYTFDFVVSRSLVGIYQEQAAQVQQLLSWTDNLKRGLGQGKFGQFIEDPDKNVPRDPAPAPVDNTPTTREPPSPVGVFGQTIGPVGPGF